MQLRYEIEHVRQCLKKGLSIPKIIACITKLINFLSGLIESPVVTLNNSSTVQEIMDQLRKQIGVRFGDDEPLS